jgi:hypothetical protein
MSNTTTTIPSKDTDFLAWVNERASLWNSHFASIGITQAFALEMKTATDASQAAWATMQNARRAAKEATEAWREAKAANRAVASAGVKTIRTFASRAEKPAEVYALSGVPAPKTPNFGVPPGTPGNVTVALDVNTGALDVRFECNNPPGLSGTVYIVNRAAATTAQPNVFGPFQQVAITSTKRFTDATLIAGTPRIQYQITAQRGSVVGNPSLPVTVSFGRSGNGAGASITVTEGELSTVNNAGNGVNSTGGKPKLAA